MTRAKSSRLYPDIPFSTQKEDQKRKQERLATPRRGPYKSRKVCEGHPLSAQFDCKCLQGNRKDVKDQRLQTTLFHSKCLKL